MPTNISQPDLSRHLDIDLFRSFAAVLGEMRRRKLIRSHNNPVADYAENLAASALSLELKDCSCSGYDAVDSKGLRYQIKARRLTAENTSRQLSALRNLAADPFDYLAGILFNADFSIFRACLIPRPVVLAHAAYREHVNAHIFHLRDSIWLLDGVQDLTRQLQQAQSSPRPRPTRKPAVP